MAQFERKFTGGQSRDAVLILESNQNHATVKDTEICPTLPASMGMGGCCHTLSREAGRAVVIIRSKENGTDMTYQSVAGTLSPGGHPGSYNGQDAYNDMLVTDDGCSMHGERAALPNHNEANRKRAGLYARRAGRSGEGGCNDMNEQKTASIVRRLTPLECERLQGYPDFYTDIGEWTDSKGKKHKDADSPRYKALGNSIALPFWRFLARRICAQYERDITLGSLFDGIGGFPLVFERCGAKAVWASEIEEFPIAVTKKHFPEAEDGMPVR